MIRTMRMTTISLFACFLAAGCGAPEDGSLDVDEVGSLSQGLISCYGESCNSVEVSATNCDADAMTVASAAIGTVGTVAIRYSRACNAAWTRTSSNTPYFMRAELTRFTSPNYNANGGPPTLMTALRSPMIGVQPGILFRGTGRIGTSYGLYPWYASTSKTF